MPEVGTLDELKNYMFKTIADIGADFKEPDDDWLMVGAFESRDGNIHLGLMPNEAFASDQTKDALAEMIKQYIGNEGIVNYAILFNVHGVENRNMADLAEVQRRMATGQRIQEMPGSYEMLMLVTGNEATEIAYTNRIERDGESPPHLTEWVTLNNPELTGRFAGFNQAIKPLEI